MMKNNNAVCYIVGAATVFDISIDKRQDDMIIAADGGQKTLEKFGIMPDIIVGDFDSSLCPENIENVVKLSPKKDFTDTYKAVQIGENNGYSNFVIYGGLGDRLDHTIANIQIANELSKKGYNCKFVGNNESAIVITNGKISFDEKSTGVVSVFSLSDKSESVCERGLKYTIENHTLTNIFPLGVSNEFVGERAEISVESGSLLVIFSNSATPLVLPF